MTDDIPDSRGDRAHAASRLQVPAIFLILISILNLVLALWSLIGSIPYLSMDEKQVRTAVQQTWTTMPPELQKMYGSFEDFERIFPSAMKASLIWSGVSALCAFLAIMGAVGMLKLKWRGLAITGAILTTIPGLTCTSCLLVGEGIGIWCMVVLFSSDVGAGFAANQSRSYQDPPDEYDRR